MRRGDSNESRQLEIAFDYNNHDEAELMWIPVAECQPHPLNPRMSYNEEQVERISEQIKQHGYKPEHAITVRPINEHYEIVSGHHRVEACKRINQEKILAWVKGDMSDEEAHSLLLLDNDQSELTPLEKGRHAFDHIEQFDHKGGRGKTGGVSDYARIHGLERVAVIQWIDAYRVAKTCKLFTGLSPTILYEISKSPEPTWQPLCQHALDEEWTVAQTKDFVKTINTIEKAIPDWWNVDFLSVVELAISNKTKAKSLKAMFTEASEIASSLKTVTIYQHKKDNEIVERDGREYYVLKPIAVEYDQKEEFLKRVKQLTTLPTKAEIQEIKKSIIEYVNEHSEQSVIETPVLSDAEWQKQKQKEDELRIMKEKEKYTPKLFHDDVLDGLRSIHNESVDLVCADPPYNIGENEWDKFDNIDEYLRWSKEWLTECYRVLKATGSIYVFGWKRILGQLGSIMDEIGFQYKDWIIWDTIQGAGGGLWVNRYEAILYYSKTDEPYEDAESVKLERHEENIREYKGKEYQFKNPSNIWRFPCVDDKHPDRTEHPTQKPVELIERIIKANCPLDGLVLDPFIGSGTTGVAAMKNRRLSIGIDNEKEYLDIARSRFENVAPSFVSPDSPTCRP